MPQTASLFDNTQNRPLPDRLRPARLGEVIGQDHLLAEEAPIGQMVKAGRLNSLVLWGPPGCGKTTIARLLAKEVDLYFEPLSAVAAGVADLRKVFDEAIQRWEQGKGTLLFVDEIHRFNRAQQDVLLPYIEDGTVVLVGATTENPSFELNGALLSRLRVFTLNRLSDESLSRLIKRAEELEDKRLPLTPEARRSLLAMADGDGRYALVLAESLFQSFIKVPLDVEALTKFVQKRPPLYDKAQEGHYNLISALHKSLRGSDCDAALYWFARMLDGGEDPKYIARRLLRFAAEDVGLADPQAMSLALAAWQSYERLGSPEGELALAEAVVYLATAPKSNAVYMAKKAAEMASSRYGSMMPPKHILNAPTSMMREMGYGAGYAYDHDEKDGFSGQNYFPDGMQRQCFYKPVERGFEREIRKRLDYWAGLREQKSKK
ncbi:MAG: replication-associated recombination protein A [Alphaproteobacteria bacterium]|nr:replication-associated recombination protein A [Alphaproteobacteria bacterium]